MTAVQPLLPMRDELEPQAFMALRLGTWLSNGSRAVRLVGRLPSGGELRVEDYHARSSFRTTPDHLIRSGYRPVKRKPRQSQEVL